LAPLALAAVGLVIYMSTIRFSLGRSPIVTVIISYGFIFIVEQTIILTYGGNPRMIPNPIAYNIPFIGGAYPLYRILAAAFSALVIAGLLVFLRKTRYGLWIRATNQDPEMALNVGIPTRKVFAGVFCLGSALAGLGGALAAPIVSVSFDMGHNIIIEAFIVVIMAGFGSIRGTVAAALILSVIMGLSSAFVDPVMAKVIGLAVMVLVLFARPQGLFGEK
jgi:branched-chain amino acid transport system permease protein